MVGVWPRRNFSSRSTTVCIHHKRVDATSRRRFSSRSTMFCTTRRHFSSRSTLFDIAVRGRPIAVEGRGGLKRATCGCDGATRKRRRRRRREHFSNSAKSASVQRGALDGRTADDGYLPRLASSMTIVPCLDTLPWAGTPSWTKNDAGWLTTGIYHASHPV